MNNKPKVYAHGCYIGGTGYNHHTRDFFRPLSKLVNLKVRNFTVGESWVGMNNEPHNNEPYLNKTDKKLLTSQTLSNSDNNRNNHSIYSNYSNKFKHNVNLILGETNHHYYYDSYEGPKIAYNVWESTTQPVQFFNKLLEYDQIWVPSKWQAECTIAQGADSNKVKVVPEGVDVNIFKPNLNKPKRDKLQFLIIGRWEYRKYTTELIQTFNEMFRDNDNVELVLIVDNKHSQDGLNNTQERLEYHKLNTDKIKVISYLPREEYIKLIRNTDVFLSCSRSEGWNLPLIEAMSCGIPSIYSNCSGQLEFAKGIGLPVDIIGEVKDQMGVGNYYEPDIDHLGARMWEVYNNYNSHLKIALDHSKTIHKEFNWNRVAEIGRDTLEDFLNNYQPPLDSNKINITLHPDIKVEITGNNNKQYNVQFNNDNETIFEDNISNNMWCRIPSDKLNETLSIQIKSK